MSGSPLFYALAVLILVMGLGIFSGVVPIAGRLQKMLKK